MQTCALVYMFPTLLQPLGHTGGCFYCNLMVVMVRYPYMAFLKLTSGKYVKVSPEQGSKLWLLSTGELEASKEEMAKLAKVQHIILNRKNPLTPASYLEAYPSAVEQDYKAIMGLRR